MCIVFDGGCECQGRLCLVVHHDSVGAELGFQRMCSLHSQDQVITRNKILDNWSGENYQLPGLF